MLDRIREGIACGDLRHLDRVGAVATYLVDTPDGVAVVDPGPSSCREAFDETLRLFGAARRDLRHVFLTHIHLDHAGLCGALVREVPGLVVHVHERGAAHLLDPSRLMASARRVFGDDLDRLWGEMLPVPDTALRVLHGGERILLGTRKWRAAATPGHAVHHLAYLDETDGVAFTGDVAGEGTHLGTPALPAAPPPDIDVEAWHQSLRLVGDWRCEALLLTHFGAIHRPAQHLAELGERLDHWATEVRASLARPGSDEARADEFADAEWERLTSHLPEALVARVDRESIHSSWFGLARYWRTRPAAADAGAS